MIKGNKIIGIDVGGSHVSASVIDFSKQERQTLHFRKRDINSRDSAYNILEAIGNCIKEIVKEETTIDAVGLAFPGPFNYKKGVCAITGVGGKFESIFGIHVLQALKSITGLHDKPFSFANDAHCFATGTYHRHQLKSKRTVFLTLGTGFGSAFMKDGVLLTNHELIPASGTFYDQDFLSAKAEDYFSTRWFLNEYKQRTGNHILSVKELAEGDSEIALSIFSQFGSNLGTFLLPWLIKFECDELIIGGNIAKASSLFGRLLIKELEPLNPSLNVVYCDDTEECILTGAASFAGDEIGKQASNDVVQMLRKTSQPLLPVTSVTPNNPIYNIYPSYKSAYSVYVGFDSLAEKIGNEKNIIIDGYGGVLWEVFREHLQQALYARNKKVFWYDINTCLHMPEKISAMIADHLNGDDPVFGKKYTGVLADFFDGEKFKMLLPDTAVDLCILYGTGAALSGWKGLLVYVDTPKNEIQYRMRRGSVKNIGSEDSFPKEQMYKRAYFVDWPVLNKQKEHLLFEADYIVDEQRINEITWMNGDDFRIDLNKVLEQPFRVRPWFEAGLWGGDWMKKHIPGLNQDEINYAWSFELITPENGIVIEGNNHLMEVSFDFLLFYNNKKLLGRASGRFGNEFPIRFDFLDTFNGGNLSLQCHPRTKYIKDNFGENFTQDETYYILDCEQGAAVYLGFQEDINPGEFKTALLDAQKNGVEIQVEKFVQKWKAHKHDLFLIPAGTVHASGRNNMVLEISNTPYIFTFKMYDWLRRDFNGRPRPINIEHAFNNLHFDRKGEYVKKYLISEPQIIEEWEEGRRLKLPTHEDHFYTVDRYEFTGQKIISTQGQCHCCMLVEGDTIDIIAGDHSKTFNYAETFVVPASVGNYSVRSHGNKRVYLIIAYVKDADREANER